MEANSHSIYAYKEPAAFLNDMWEIKRRKNPHFTIRAWAQTMGLKAHNPLYEAVKGKRKVPKSYIPLLVRSLSLSPKEGLYLEALIDFQRARKEEEKNYYADRINELTPKKHITFFELETFQFFRDPAHFALLEMVDLKGFQYDLEWIQKKLGIKKTISEIERMIDRLVSLGFFKEKKDELLKVQDHIYSQVDKHDQALKDYHKKIMSYATKALEHQSLDDREYNGVCFNVLKKDIKKLKEEIRAFQNKIIASYEAKKGKAKSTYQLNIQLFNLNEKID